MLHFQVMAIIETDDQVVNPAHLAPSEGEFKQVSLLANVLQPFVEVKSDLLSLLGVEFHIHALEVSVHLATHVLQTDEWLSVDLALGIIIRTKYSIRLLDHQLKINFLGWFSKQLQESLP